MSSTIISDFTIRLASDAQKEQQRRAEFVPWSDSRTWERYIEAHHRTKECSHDDWAKDGTGQGWVLVKRTDLEGSIYSSCLTFRRKSFYKDPSSGEIKDCISYDISSVVTPEKHRGTGFAKHLLRLLHYQIGSSSNLPPFPATEWGPPRPPHPSEIQAAIPPGLSSILWSAVGSKFYEKATIGIESPGWVVMDDDCQQVIWKIIPPLSKTSSDRQDWDWIYTRDLPALGEGLSVAAREHLSYSESDPSIISWSPDPASTGLLQYAPGRTLRFQSEDWHTVYDTEPCGIRLPATGPGQPAAIVIFTPSPSLARRALLITYIHNLTPDHLPILLEALDEFCSKRGLVEGCAWGISADGPLLKAWSALEGRVVKMGRRDEIDGDLLAVAWYGPSGTQGRIGDSQYWLLV